MAAQQGVEKLENEQPDGQARLKTSETDEESRPANPPASPSKPIPPSFSDPAEVVDLTDATQSPLLPEAPSSSKLASTGDVVPTPSSQPISQSLSAPTETPQLVHPVPLKPRSNSVLQSSRPPPPSPATSRPASQILSLSGSGSPILSSSPGGGGFRDRASSTSSSRGPRSRRSSHAASSGRNPSRQRPKSGLGSQYFAYSDESSPADTPGLGEGPIGLGLNEPGSGAISPPAGSHGGQSTPSSNLPETSLTTTSIPEHPSPPARRDASATPVTSPTPPGGASTPTPAAKIEASITIRDYAFLPSDPRFNGPGLPLTAPETSSSRSSRWLAPDDGESSGKKSGGWGGFGLFSWRGFGKKRDSTDSTQSPGEGEEEEGEGVTPDEFPMTSVPDHDEDDYAFSSDSGGEDEEPWGLHRAMFAFEAVGDHEIGLEEGDLIDVRGRGGGDGWVIGVKRYLGADGKVTVYDGQEVTEGLVPETYLEKVDHEMVILKEGTAETQVGDGQDEAEKDPTKAHSPPVEDDDLPTPTVPTSARSASHPVQALPRVRSEDRVGVTA